jgi:uncharacterized protein
VTSRDERVNTVPSRQLIYVERMEGLDALRGFALMALFLVHALELFELWWVHPYPSLIHNVMFMAFSGKAFSLLALCFGISFFIIMDRSARRGIDFSGRFAWRLVLLALLGYLHGLIYRGDILQVLAVVGLLLIPLNRIKSNWLLIAIAGLFFLQPGVLFQIYVAAKGAAWAEARPSFLVDTANVYLYGSFADNIRANLINGQLIKWWYMIEYGRLSQLIGLFLIGLVLGRIGLFQTPRKFARGRTIALIVAIASAAGLYFGRDYLAELVAPQHGFAQMRFETILFSLFDLSFMAVLMLGFMQLYYGFAGRMLNLLAPAGRMTLTLYIMQSVVFVPIYFGFGLGLHDDITQAEALALGAGFFAAQLVFAHVWFQFFLYGPLEWLWRAGTYLTVNVPFLRSAPPLLAQGSVAASGRTVDESAS